MNNTNLQYKCPVYTYIHTYIHVCVYACVYVWYVCACMYVYSCTLLFCLHIEWTIFVYELDVLALVAFIRMTLYIYILTFSHAMHGSKLGSLVLCRAWVKPSLTHNLNQVEVAGSQLHRHALH